MCRMILNQKGSIGVAIIVAIIAAVSGVSLSSVAFRDTHSFRLQLDAAQELHLLRTELGRGRMMVSTLEDLDLPPALTVLPHRNINIDFGRHRTVYSTKTKLRFKSGGTGTFARDSYIIESLISAVRGRGGLVSEEQISPIKKYGENHIKSNATLAMFHYFTDADIDHSGIPGNIRFYGADVVNGRTHSNSDIYIRMSGGGNNGGWPTFLALVTTSGKIRVYPGGGTSYPKDQIFRGGLIEEYPKIEYNPTADMVRLHGHYPFNEAESDNTIYFLTVSGRSYSGYKGVVNNTQPETIPVYSSYPPYGPIGTEIAQNIVTIKDTVWTPESGIVPLNKSIFVPGELWISGKFSGQQTWASSGDMYLKDDILLFNTERGDYPDGGPEGSADINNSDYVGLVSEGHIFVQYGYKDPGTGIRHKPNSNNIYIYAAMASLKMGDPENPFDNGVFTFQYQLPKGSTPDQFYEGNFYRKIDLHRFHYPTTVQNPWPPQLDYPWYNPLWPEPGPSFPPRPNIPNPHNTEPVTYLRGTIHLYGSVAQRNRGFVRRSGTPDYDTGIWDIENNLFGGASGRPSGYDKNYYYDTRFDTIGPPDYPLVKYNNYGDDELMDLGYETISWIFKKPPSNY